MTSCVMFSPTMRVPSSDNVRTLGDAWLRLLGEWLPASGERMAASECYELYANDQMTTPKKQLRTELYVPLQ